MASHGVARSARRVLSASEKSKELKQISQYQSLVSQVQELYGQRDFNSSSLQLTTALLSQNPEFYTIWNYRRLILSDVFARELSAPPRPPSPLPSAPFGPSDAGGADLTAAQREISLLLREDLTFLLPLQRFNPKVYWLWNHRSWLLGQASAHLPVVTARGFWTEELGLVEKMLGRDERNFHGWAYRREVVGALEALRVRELAESAGRRPPFGEDEERAWKAQASLARREFEYADKMVRANLSNFSAWHHRLRQIYRLLEGKEAGDPERKRMFDAELGLVTEGLWVCTGPKDQSLWFYHLDLMATLDPEAREEIKILKGTGDEARRGYVEGQTEAVMEILDDNEDCKWVYQALLDLQRLYKRSGGEVNKAEMKTWLDRLDELDPLRKDRWVDLRKDLEL